KHIAAYAGFMFIHSVIVARDGTGTDIYVCAQLSVADVAEVVDLAAFANDCLFGFDEVAHFSAFGKARSRSNSRKWTYMTFLSDLCIIDHTVGFDMHTISDNSIFDYAVGSNSDVIAQSD